MALILGDRVADDFTRARWRATDSVLGKPVSVHITHKALQDFGEPACLAKAVKKFVSPAGAVHITNDDF